MGCNNLRKSLCFNGVGTETEGELEGFRLAVKFSHNRGSELDHGRWVHLYLQDNRPGLDTVRQCNLEAEVRKPATQAAVMTGGGALIHTLMSSGS